MNKPILLTRYQWRILTFVQQHFAQHKMSPTIKEIADGSGISSTSVVDHNLCKLEGVGLIKRQPYICRTIVLQATQSLVGVIP